MKKILLLFITLLIGCSEENIKEPIIYDTEFVNFIELGSTTCSDCIKMQDVIKSLEERYGDNLIIDFIDVIKKHEEAKKYKIVVMPTQVFFNDKGEEIHRHEGYYYEEEIDEFLAKCKIYPIK